MNPSSDLLRRAELYAESNSIAINRQPLLGHGSDGSVWSTSRNTALKVLAFDRNFQNELECYRRLQDAQVRTLDEFAIPSLIGFDEALMAIEMSIVEPPYLLDFGKVYLDIPPPYYGDKQLMRNALREWRGLFGADWPRVADVVDVLRHRFGIYYVDPRPANINTGRQDDDVTLESDPLGDDPFENDE